MISHQISTQFTINVFVLINNCIKIITEMGSSHKHNICHCAQTQYFNDVELID